MCLSGMTPFLRWSSLLWLRRLWGSSCASKCHLHIHGASCIALAWPGCFWFPFTAPTPPTSAHQKQGWSPLQRLYCWYWKLTFIIKVNLCARHSSEHAAHINSFDLCMQPVHMTVINADFTDEEIKAWRLCSLPRPRWAWWSPNQNPGHWTPEVFLLCSPCPVRSHLGILFTCFFLRSSQGLSTAGALGLPDKI